MKRKLIQRLIDWKECIHRPPFLLTGRKGTGKTYLACDFAKSFYEDYIYINFETNPEMNEILFQDPKLTLVEALNRYFELPEGLLSSVPVIFDEISFSNSLMARLTEQESLYSALGDVFFLMLSSYESDLPEGLKNACSVSCAVLRGLEFDEFLIATSNDWYIDVIKGHYEAGKKVPEIVHNELLALFEDYLVIGGIPSAVNESINMASTVNVAEQHRLLLDSYYTEIGKRNPEGDALKMRQVCDTIARQLVKENRKFQYRLIRKGATSTLYGHAIEYLCDNGYLLRCPKEGEQSQFKLYLPDVGLLHTMLPKQLKSTVNAEMLQTVPNENCKKALLENYVIFSLIGNGYRPCFWESASAAKIDFIIQKEGERIPIEVRPGENTRTKSIGVYKQHFDFPYSVKISARNFEITPDIRYLPYYAVFCL